MCNFSSSSKERVRAKLSVVGNRIRSHSGSRGRDAASAGFNAAILLLFQLTPKTSELVRAEIREDFAIHINHGGKFLSGEIDHFIVSRLVRNHIHRFIINLMLVEPTLGFVAPAAIWFHEQSYFLWFHTAKLRDNPTFFKCELKRSLVSEMPDRTSNSLSHLIY